MGDVIVVDPYIEQIIDQTGLSDRITNLEDKYVRTTRFAVISGPSTSGAVTLPPQSLVVLDDFGGTVDAVLSTLDGGRPDLLPVYTASNQLVATTFDSSGNYSLSGTPASFPIAIVYRIKQLEINFDSDSEDIIGAPEKDTYLQKQIDDLVHTAAVSASPGFTWGGAGIKNAGSYLLNDSVPSNLAGRMVPLVSGVISQLFVSASAPSTCTIAVQKLILGVWTTIETISLSNEQTKVSDGSAPVALGDELSLKIDTGSITDPVVGVVIRGSV